MILAIDFDGTLCKDAYPKIGEPNENLIAHLIMFKNKGHKLILWTCREEKDLWEAVQWCESFGLFFDAINENIFPTKKGFEEYGKKQRKVYADYYIDDRSLLPDQIINL